MSWLILVAVVTKKDNYFQKDSIMPSHLKRKAGTLAVAIAIVALTFQNVQLKVPESTSIQTGDIFFNEIHGTPNSAKF